VPLTISLTEPGGTETFNVNLGIPEAGTPSEWMHFVQDKVMKDVEADGNREQAILGTVPQFAQKVPVTLR
jgi:hypothetical protein